MLTSFLTGFAVLIAYFVVSAATALAIRRFVSVPGEVFRKILHLILLGSLPVFLLAFDRWWMAVLASLLFVAVVFPVLALGERIDGYSELPIERKGGEIKNSLVVVFVMYALMISISWGGWVSRGWRWRPSTRGDFGGRGRSPVGKKYGSRVLEGGTIEDARALRARLRCLQCRSSPFSQFWSCTPASSPSVISIPVLAAAVSAAIELYTPGWVRHLTSTRICRGDPPLVHLLGSRRPCHTATGGRPTNPPGVRDPEALAHSWLGSDCSSGGRQTQLSDSCAPAELLAIIVSWVIYGSPPATPELTCAGGNASNASPM